MPHLLEGEPQGGQWCIRCVCSVELVYITRDGITARAPARLTTGNTLIWGTRQVALRLEGDFGKAAALTVASSARK